MWAIFTCTDNAIDSYGYKSADQPLKESLVKKPAILKYGYMVSFG